MVSPDRRLRPRGQLRLPSGVEAQGALVSACISLHEAEQQKETCLPPSHRQPSSQHVHTACDLSCSLCGHAALRLATPPDRAFSGENSTRCRAQRCSSIRTDSNDNGQIFSDVPACSSFSAASSLFQTTLGRHPRQPEAYPMMYSLRYPSSPSPLAHGRLLCRSITNDKERGRNA